MKEKIIEILKEYQHELPQLSANTSDLAITDDQFDDVAEAIVKLCNLHVVSKSFVSGLKLEITGCFIGHEFEIGETVTLIEESGEQWLAENSKGERWYIIPEETNAC